MGLFDRLRGRVYDKHKALVFARKEYVQHVLPHDRRKFIKRFELEIQNALQRRARLLTKAEVRHVGDRCVGNMHSRKAARRLHHDTEMRFGAIRTSLQLCLRKLESGAPRSAKRVLIKKQYTKLYIKMKAVREIIQERGPYNDHAADMALHKWRFYQQATRAIALWLHEGNDEQQTIAAIRRVLTMGLRGAKATA